jgi:hypothetical protein
MQFFRKEVVVIYVSVNNFLPSFIVYILKDSIKASKPDLRLGSLSHYYDGCPVYLQH